MRVQDVFFNQKRKHQKKNVCSHGPGHLSLLVCFHASYHQSLPHALCLSVYIKSLKKSSWKKTPPRVFAANVMSDDISLD
jgi:hypothetical protein